MLSPMQHNHGNEHPVGAFLTTLLLWSPILSWVQGTLVPKNEMGSEICSNLVSNVVQNLLVRFTYVDPTSEVWQAT